MKSLVVRNIHVSHWRWSKFVTVQNYFVGMSYNKVNLNSSHLSFIVNWQRPMLDFPLTETTINLLGTSARQTLYPYYILILCHNYIRLLDMSSSLLNYHQCRPIFWRSQLYILYKKLQHSSVLLWVKVGCIKIPLVTLSCPFLIFSQSVLDVMQSLQQAIWFSILSFHLQICALIWPHLLIYFFMSAVQHINVTLSHDTLHQDQEGICPLSLVCKSLHHQVSTVTRRKSELGFMISPVGVAGRPFGKQIVLLDCLLLNVWESQTL